MTPFKGRQYGDTSSKKNRLLVVDDRKGKVKIVNIRGDLRHVYVT